MRVAFIHPSYPGGDGTGATYSATKIVEGLRDTGHDVSVFCTESPKADVIDGIEIRDIQPESRNPHPRLSLDQKLRSITEKFSDFDIIHSYLMLTMSALEEIKRETTTPIVLTLNAYGAVCPKNDLLYAGNYSCTEQNISRCLKCITRTNLPKLSTGAMQRLAYQLGNLKIIESGLQDRDIIDGYQALSTHVKETYSEFGFDESTIRVIPNILNENFLVQDTSPSSTRILFVGYFHRHKGVDLLVPTMEQYVSKKDSEAQLTIAGTGPLESELQKQISNSSVSDQITLLGKVPNNKLPEIYSRHNVFLYPGRWNEPFGRVFLEALSSQTPVVSTNVGAVSEIVGNAGVIVDENPFALAEGVKQITDNHDEFVGSTRDRLPEFRSSSVIPQFEELYRSAQDGE